MKKSFLVLFILIVIDLQIAISQQIVLNGTVKSYSDKKPLINANLYWFGTQNGTISDENGKFEIIKPSNESLFLIISYLGFKTDTVLVKKNQTKIEIFLNENNILSEVEIGEKRDASYISKINPIQTQTITTCGLQKMACCNLSESFENNASVDVAYTDAVSGAKQIQLLGLAGIYSQIITENNSSIKGLASSYGLGYIPGTWMESIQISKGASTVLNGYESITGQINIEYKKPQLSEPFHINIYGNEWGKTEANITSAVKLNENVSTMILMHGEIYDFENDKNSDSFLDMPKTKQINLFNRWKFKFKDKYVSQLGIKILSESRNGGQFKNIDTSSVSLYKLGITTNRYEAFFKAGASLNEDRDASIGFVFNSSLHELNSYFGLTDYIGNEQSITGNLIYQTNVFNSENKFNAGLSYNYKNTDEELNATYLDTNIYKTEAVPGIFAQYTYSYNRTFTAIAGIRSDFHNSFGNLITPRLHLKYNLNENNSLKLSGGKGYRNADIIAENIGLLASSKKLIFKENLNIEQAWNYGISYTKFFKLFTRKGTFIVDLFRTDFVNQIIVDMDSRYDQVSFYNLNGQSYSNSFQIEVILEPIERFEINGAFRLNDVHTTINEKLQSKPFVNKYKGMLALSYATKFEKWKFDFTSQYVGEAQLPETNMLPEKYQRPEKSPDFFIIHAQITRQFKWWNVYIGVENLTNFTQANPIIASDNPFGEYFDSTFLWGPIIGRSIYAGIRLTIK